MASSRQIAFLPALVLAALPLCAAEMSQGALPRAEDYTLLWWADGPPRFLSSTVPPASGTLCLQSGLWGLAFDTERVRALRAGRWPAPMGWTQAVQPGRAALGDLPPAEWDCAITVGSNRYACVGHLDTRDEFRQPVRFVESGRFFQRVVIEGLRFADAAGKELASPARLEISAWPDRLSMRLELEPTDPAQVGLAELRLGQRRASAPLSARTSVCLALLDDNDAPRPDVVADPELKVAFDEALGCHTLALPEKPWSNASGTYYPAEHLDRLDRWRVVLRNDFERPAVARLMFTQRNRLPVTGFTPMLCETDGVPTGVPVQISKNWHESPEKGDLPHQGPWFHGFALVRLPPKSEQAFCFQMAYARYGGVFAASHAQLCLIGWGHNQFWDEAAIGSFGESICFEPGRVQRRCFIDDVRPLMTKPHGRAEKPWGWSGNCGGGDFLMWQDEAGHYQPMRATRTRYRAYGPCLTDVSYTEESAGGEVSARMDVAVPRSDDHLRAFLHLRYDIHRPLRWQRLAFFQLGSDYYNNTPARRVAVGDATGIREEWEPTRGQNIFDRRAVPLTGPQAWVSIHGVDREVLRSDQAAASRGLIVRSWRATLGGRDIAIPHVSFFGTGAGRDQQRTVVELAPPSGLTDLRPGDFVEADLELVVFPADAAAFYGPNKAFAEALSRDADTGRLVQREAAGNAIRARARRGRVAKAYPLVVALDDRQGAEVTLAGGLGYVPVTLTGLDQARGYALQVDGMPLNQSIHGNDFWQTNWDADAGQFRMTFNVLLSGDRPHTIRFARSP